MTYIFGYYLLQAHLHKSSVILAYVIIKNYQYNFYLIVTKISLKY